jgi:hypothetical protein
MVLGKNPRVVGAAGANELRSQLPTQTRADEASFARMQAMREVAKLSMLRVHYSRALRRAAVARPRPTIGWEQFSVGDVVYFFRERKAIPKKLKLIQRRRLALRRWHGPGVLLALQGGNVPTAGYVAFRGNITKVAMEHMRHASALERLTAGDWEEVLNEVIAANEDVAQPPALQDGAPLETVPELDDVERGDDGQPRPDQV